ncbi:hypothetical protein [Pyrobaculum ferrireducens]|uniref:hypothetical protein n=1 Tax=Pyrobaculum ferrireducens TaxID=1104324 RepID=UPI000A9B7CB7|nr:hypothetical protein [Pyrobaculum ferrireducens]
MGKGALAALLLLAAVAAVGVPKLCDMVKGQTAPAGTPPQVRFDGDGWVDVTIRVVDFFGRPVNATMYIYARGFVKTVYTGSTFQFKVPRGMWHPVEICVWRMERHSWGEWERATCGVYWITADGENGVGVMGDWFSYFSFGEPVIYIYYDGAVYTDFIYIAAALLAMYLGEKAWGRVKRRHAPR